MKHLDRELVFVRDRVRPVLRRHVEPRLGEILCERHKTYAEAGNNDGRFWSPFKETCERLERVLRERPGLTIREAVKQIKHHYASDSGAVSSLHTWIAWGKVPGVELSDERPARLYLAGTAPVAPHTESFTGTAS